MKLTVLICAVAAACTWAAPTLAIPVRPDDRAGPQGPGVTTLSTSLRPDDRAGFRGIGHAPDATALSGPQPTRGAASGFDWSAAGVGAIAGVAAAVVVLLVWALALRRSHRRVEASA
jgi:hypothetical protein